MMFKPICIPILALFGMMASSAIAEINYSKSLELPALRISLSELQDVLNKGASLMGLADGGVPILREEMELRRGELSVKISGHQLNLAGARIPELIDRFRYTISTRDPSPISSLSFDFSDFSQTLSVEGQSPDQVDATFSALRDELWNMSSTVGGGFQTSFAMMIASFILLLGSSLLAVECFQNRNKRLILPIGLAVLILIGLWALPLRQLTTGFSAVNGDASFGVRYGAEISLMSLIVGGVALIASFIPLFIGKPNKR
jgi:hypothetical protein